MAYITFLYENCLELKNEDVAHTQVTSPHKTEKLKLHILSQMAQLLCERQSDKGVPICCVY